jgi:drug/metabolite transporter (DMT)-like permease
LIFLVLAIVAGLSVSVVFKLVGSRGVDRLTFITTNYIAAGITAFVVLMIGNANLDVVSDPGLTTFGIALGAIFIGGFMLFSWAIPAIGVAIVIGVLRTSIVLAFLASWLVWNEEPSGAQFVGMFIAVSAFFLISKLDEPGTTTTSGPSRKVKFIVLTILFFNIGTVDLSMKAFDEWFADDFHVSVFAWLIFSSAATYGLIAIVVRGFLYSKWPDMRSVGWGVVLGVINFGSIDFLVRALDILPGTFVLPINGIAGTIGATALGVVVWREHLSRVNWIGIGMATTALVLLNL